MSPINLRKLHKHYFLMYCLIIFIAGIGSFYAFYLNYMGYEARIKDELLREANITNVHVEGSLIGAQNLLDYDIARISDRLNAGTLSDESAYAIMHNAQNMFGSFIADKVFKLTLYIDEQGVLRATSQAIAKTPIDFSDQLYFQSLKMDPQNSYVIGDLVIAKTTGLLTFHLAEPIIDRNGKFRGILAQQFIANNISKVLEKSLDGLSDVKIFIHAGDGNVTFAYPNPINKDDIDADVTSVQYLSELIHLDGKRSNSFSAPASKAFPQSSYVGYAISDAHNLVTSVSIPKKSVLIRFMSEAHFLLVYIEFAFIALTIMFWFFYRSAVKNSYAMEQSYIDSLTQLKNRRALDIELPVLWKESMRSKNPISALFIDIDHFKVFNDNYGHKCGDTALKAVARAIQGCITRPLDLCCRWGGEEFVVVLPNTDEHGAVFVTNKVMAAVRSIRFNFMPDITPHISVSIGVVTVIVSEKNKTDDLIDMADKAMYKAKSGGRNCYIVDNKTIAFG